MKKLIGYFSVSLFFFVGLFCSSENIVCSAHYDWQVAERNLEFIEFAYDLKISNPDAGDSTCVFIDSAYLSPIYYEQGSGCGDLASGEVLLWQNEYCASSYTANSVENILYVAKYEHGKITAKKVLFCYKRAQEKKLFLARATPFFREKLPATLFFGSVDGGTRIIVRSFCLIDSLNDSTRERLDEVGKVITNECYRVAMADTVNIGTAIVDSTSEKVVNGRFGATFFLNTGENVEKSYDVNGGR